MKTLKRILSSLQNDIYYFLSLGLIVLTYGLDLRLNIALYFLFIINLGVNLREDRFLYTFFALVLFELQVHSNLILSGWMFTSLIQIYYIAFAVRVIFDIFSKTKIKLDIIAGFTALWFIATAVQYQTNFSSGVLFMIKNCAVVLYILFYLKANMERSRAVGEVLSVIALFILFAGAYALTYSVYWDGRLCSTVHDPNYSAMFYGMGIFASFGATLFKKWFKVILTVALSVLMLGTMSITGIFLTGLILIVYFLITQGIKRVAIVAGILVALLAGILLVPTQEGTTFNKLQNRVNKFYVIDETDYTLVGHDDYTQTQLYLNYITNNRYYLVEGYSEVFSELPTQQKLFGGLNVMTGPYREKMTEQFSTVSHNSYIDMAFMVGLVFTGLLIFLIVLRLIQLFKEYRKTRSRQVLCLILMKMVVIAFGLTISYFPYRYYVVFMML
ncbi:MAG: hypothetical protein AB1Z19_07880 [Eubacteriales bacterium]